MHHTHRKGLLHYFPGAICLLVLHSHNFFLLWSICCMINWFFIPPLPAAGYHLATFKLRRTRPSFQVASKFASLLLKSNIWVSTVSTNYQVAVVSSNFFEEVNVLSGELKASPVTVKEYFFLRFLTVWSTETSFVTYKDVRYHGFRDP